jgi:hypothetical protein
MARKKVTRRSRETPLERLPLEEQIAWAKVHNPSGVAALEHELDRRHHRERTENLKERVVRPE